MEGLAYITSRYCPTGNCVEAAVTPDGAVALRDSKDRSKPPHLFTREEWDAFVSGVKVGDFDFFEAVKPYPSTHAEYYPEVDLGKARSI
jgi:hypothetical protein